VSLHINQLISKGESEQLDFKFEISDAKKIARTFSAFANTRGGTLLIGVKDNGTIAGIKTDEEAYMVESAAHIFCRPRVEYTLKPWMIQGKTILEVIICESQAKPHLAPWKDNLWRAFIRLKDENYVASSIQVEVWKKLSIEKPVLVRFKKSEKLLLAYLQKNEDISLKSFCRLADISYQEAKKIMVNLISIGIIRIHYHENISTFCLNEVHT